MEHQELKSFLDEKFEQYHGSSFLDSDPISIPHRFSNPKDIEISAFLTATISWGKRIMIIKNADTLMSLMDFAPHDFVTHYSESDLKPFQSWCHRTFQFEDLQYFLKALNRIFARHDSLEPLFTAPNDENLFHGIHRFHESFFQFDPPSRTLKHVSDPYKGSAAKRLNMFLRWMVRPNHGGVDFGLWTTIKTSQLSCPLDVHTANVARKLGLLQRNQNDWKSVEQLDNALRAFDSNDPVKYDFALFGLGVFEGL